MTLRQTHARIRMYDVAALVLGAGAGAVSFFAFRAGGAWMIPGGAVFIGLLLILWGAFVDPQRLQVVRSREPLVKSPAAWVRLVFVSDLHAGGVRPASWYERVAREAAALNPDLFVIGGDMVVDRYEPVAMLAPFASVSARIGKYFVMGNHDLMDRPEEIRTAMRTYGFENLSNRSVSLARDGRPFELSGIDDHWYGNPELPARTSPDVPRVLISHEPDVLMDLVPGEADLVFSGHTHGGQIALPFVGPIIPIPAKLGRAVARGRHILNGTTCIVSEGAGEVDVRFRLLVRPEILVVELGI